MPIVLDGTQGIQTPMYGGAIANNAVTPVVGMKNRIINGACVIDQRNAGASVTFNDNVFPVDRFRSNVSQSSKMTAQQNAGSVTPPAGFNNYLGMTSSSAYSITSTDYFDLCQFIEGFNVADLDWGTANAKTVTLSFWVRSSLTGTFGGSVANSATNRCYVFSYTISSANTWEYKTVTIPGDTTGTWLKTNNQGILLFFGMGDGASVSGTAGSWGSTFFRNVTGNTSVVGTNGATFYITGVQLEVGSTATSFDYRPYGTELALCQRYYFKIPNGSTASIASGALINATSAQTYCKFPQTMRSAPTLTISSINITNAVNAQGVTSITFSSGLDSALVQTVNGSISPSSAGQACILYTTSSTGYIDGSSEL